MTKRHRISYGNVCCVINCRNNQKNTENIRFYSFSTKPHKAEQREQWIKAVRRKNTDGSLWQPNKYTKICSAHFIDNAKSEHPMSPSFLPTIFPPCYLKSNPSEKFISSAKQRFHKYSEAGTDKGIKPKSIKISEGATTSLDVYDPMLDSPFENEGNVEVVPQKPVEIGIQLHTFSKYNHEDSNFLVCNGFVNGNVCEVQTQVNLQPILHKNFSCNISKYPDKCCGSAVTVEDKCVGPDSNYLDDKSMIKCNEGFHGLQFIKNENDINN